ncbi:MAG TPA: gamma-glutamyltransferase [Pseudonocardia sp.]
MTDRVDTGARGVVAAGHPATAAAGAQVLRDGGNAVDAAVAAVLTSFVAEPLLTGLGAGGYLLAVPPGGEPVLLDFFVEVPGRAGDPADRAPLRAVTVDFGDAEQVFHAGAPSCGTYGTPAGLAAAAAEFGRAPLHALTAPAARLARAGVRVTPMQAYLYALLAGINALTPAGRARYLPGGAPPRAGDLVRDPELADALDRFGAEGPAPFYTGDVAAAVVAEVRSHGGLLGAADLAAYEVVRRDPHRVAFRDTTVSTNPPPAAGGVLLGRALAALGAGSGPPDAPALVAAMAAAERDRTPEFLAGLSDPGPTAAACATANRLGSTTHVSVLDADGWACAVTSSNGEGSGVVVPGTGVHLNNVLGEEDLSPLGFHTQPPGTRMPSMMAPTVVADARSGRPRLVVGSAGSNRIRSTLLQAIVNVVDRGMTAQEAVDAPRLHYAPEGLYTEPGLPAAGVRAAAAAAGLPVRPFRERNLYFGGCQAVARDPLTGALSGGADPRRGGGVAVA